MYPCRPHLFAIGPPEFFDVVVPCWRQCVRFARLSYVQAVDRLTCWDRRDLLPAGDSASRRSAALVKSLRYLCLPSIDLILGRLPLAPAFIVTDAKFLAGRLPLPCLTVKTNPFSFLAIG